MANYQANNLFNAVAKLPLPKDYIDLRNIQINNTSDLVKVAYTFRNPIFETFRIIYMCDNKIVGYESITSRLPHLCNIFNFKTYNTTRENFTRGCAEMINRMFRLGANGYYLMHNHPSGDAKVSQNDIQITKRLAEAVGGFRGHIIVDHGTYSWIDIVGKETRVNNNLYVTPELSFKVDTECDHNPLIDFSVNCRNDLARLMYDVKHSENYSILTLCSTKNKVRLLQEVPNCYMNMSFKQIGGYIKNLALASGSTKAFISTTSQKVFDRATELKSLGYITDCIAYNVADNKIKILAKDDTDIVQDIFENQIKQKVKVTDKENIYQEEITEVNTKVDLFENNKEFI